MTARFSSNQQNTRGRRPDDYPYLTPGERVGVGDSPPWSRRGGCAHKQMPRSLLERAQTGRFVQNSEQICAEMERTAPSARI
jgi:hypothetical protein